MALIHVNESDFREQVLENSGMLLVFKNGQLVNKSIGFVSQPEIEKLIG